MVDNTELSLSVIMTLQTDGEHMGVTDSLRELSRNTRWWSIMLIRVCVSFGIGCLSVSTDASNILRMGFTPRGLAQVVPDGTLGSEASQLTPNVVVRGAIADQINGGAVRGANLFHSFQQFNVGDGQRVYFTNPAGIETILTRVTGVDPSTILGTLGVDGGASLFFMNPNGIVFGASARLDIAGSLVASTSPSLRFADGGEFSATNPQPVPLLVVAVPIGPQLGSSSTPVLAPIANSGSLVTGQDLTLLGGTVTSTGSLTALAGNLTLQAQDTVELSDSASNPATFLAGRNLLVQGNQGIKLALLSQASSGLRSGGDLTLRSEGTIVGDAHYRTGGNFRVEGLDGKLQGFISPNDPVIRADGSVSFDDYTGASLHIFAGGSVFVLGTITITGPDVVNGISETITLSNGQPLTVDGATVATLDIRAGTTAFNCTPVTCGTTGTPDPTNLVTFPDFFPTADIFINAIVLENSGLTTDGLVYLTNQYSPNTSATGSIQVGGIDVRNQFGNSSTVVFDSRGDIALLGANFPLGGFPGSSDPITVAIAGQTFGGNGSNITLLATGDIVNDSVIVSDGFLGGQITLNTAGGTVRLGTNSTVSSISQFGFPGDTSGNITISAANLQMQPGSSLFTQNLGFDEGGGSITIAVTGGVSLEGGNTSLFSQVGSDTLNFQIGEGGAIAITAETLSLRNNAQLFTRTFGDGKAGNITLNIADRITVDNSALFSDVRANAGGDGGTLTVTTGNLIVTNAGQLFTRTIGNGKAGNVVATASTISFLDQSNIFSQIEVGATGAGGTTTITSLGDLTITNGTRLFTRTRTAAAAGDIILKVAGNMTLTDVGFVFTEVTAGASGTGGKLDITVDGAFTATRAGGISTQTQGSGASGDIRLVIAQDATLDELGLILGAVEDNGTGRGGAIDLSIGGTFIATNGGSVATRTQGSSNSGNVSLRATQGIRLDQGGTLSTTNTQPTSLTVQGSGGTLTLRTDGTTTLSNGSRISTLTQTNGAAGAVTLLSGGAIQVDGSVIQSNAEAGTGPGGDVTITAPSLTIRNGGSVQSLTGGGGNAGRVTIAVVDSVVLDGITAAGAISSLVSTVNPGATGNGNNLTVIARSLSLTNGAQVGTATFSNGQSGNVVLQLSDRISLSGESATGRPSIVSAQSQGAGAAGTVTVQTRQLSFLQGGQVSSTAFSTGAGGKITISALESAAFNGTSGDGGRSGLVTSSVGTMANAGSGGTIDITTPRLLLSSGAQFAASTSGSGQAGNITINARDLLSLDGNTTEIAASTTAGSSGQGGSIFIDPVQVLLTNGARISVNSLGSGNGGSITLQGGNLSLDRSFITAETASGEGGNITLRVGNLFLLRNGSLVSATAGGTGNGGNLNINSRFIVAPTAENSDITANAFQGRGGNILITTDGIFGLEFRPRLTPLNDITASSEFGLQGVVTIITPNVDPSKGVVSLPGNLVDASQQIAQGCRPPGEAGQFVATGRGGLPAMPGETIAGEALWEDVRNSSTTAQTRGTPRDVAEGLQPTPAQGWVMDDRGNVTLVAQVPKPACY